MATPGLNRFAFLYQWARDELNAGNRSKASRISKVAERLRPDGNLRWYPNPGAPPSSKPVRKT